jgi:hypothetical protein
MVAALVLGGVLTALLLARPSPATVRLDGAARVVGTELQVWGTTDLPDDSIVDIGIWREDVVGSDEPVNELFDAVKVRGGRFEYAADVGGWPPGTVNVEVGFSPGIEGQPPQAHQRYGRKGERLTGPNVAYDTGEPAVMWRSSVTLPAR